MTIAKARHFQEDLRKLADKYGIQGMGAFFVHNDAVHMVEVHGTEKNQWVVAINDALTGAISHLYPNIPMANFNSAQDN